MILISFIFYILIIILLIIGFTVTVTSKSLGVSDFIIRIEIGFVILACVICLIAGIYYMIYHI